MLPKQIGECKMKKLTDLLKAEDFTKDEMVFGNNIDIIYRLKIEDGSHITVLDRLTGYGYNVRDIETGFREARNGRKSMQTPFWLVSGNFDIRDKEGITISEAIEIIKKNANACKGETR